jgi:hypothetical protein
VNPLIAIILLLLGLLLRLPAVPGGALLAEQGTPQSGPSPLSIAADLTCTDFASQTEAQQVLETDPSDPSGLDVDLDGIACEMPWAVPSDSSDAAREDRSARRSARAAAREPATPAPAAEEDLDCIDFAFQEDAQAVYDRIPGDPYNLDPSGDGIACSSLPSRGGG